MSTVKHCFKPDGWHAVEVDGVRGEWTVYQHPAFSACRRYMALTQYYDRGVGTETCFKIEEVALFPLKSVLTKEDFEKYKEFQNPELETEIVEEYYPEQKEET